MSDITSQPDPPPGIQAGRPPAPAGDPDAPPPAVVFPLHPSFWWAVLWCVFLVLVTQIPAGILAVLVMVALSRDDPAALNDLSGPAVRTGVAVAVVVAHGLIILLALLCLRMAAGRDWTRQVALRLPSIGHVLLTVAMLPAFVVLGSAADQVLRRIDYPSLAHLPGAAAFWAAVASVLLLVAILHVFCRLVGGRGWYDTLVEPLSLPSKALLSFVVLGSLVVAGVVGYWLIRPIASDMLPADAGLTGMEELTAAFKKMPLAGAVAVIAVFPALSEELWCRGFLGRGLVGRHGVFWGVLMTSFLFGAIHGDPRQGTYAMLLGAVLHVSYLASRSLLVPMFLHFLNNALAVVLLQLPGAAEVESALADSFAAIPVTAAELLLAACLFAFWQSRVRPEGMWKPPHPGVACPPPDSGTRLVGGWPSWGAAGLVVLALGLFALTFYLHVTILLAARTD